MGNNKMDLNKITWNYLISRYPLDDELIEEYRDYLCDYLRNDFAPKYLSESVNQTLNQLKDQEIKFIYQPDYRLRGGSISFSLPGINVPTYVLLSSNMTVNGVRDQDTLGQFVSFIRDKKLNQLLD